MIADILTTLGVLLAIAAGAVLAALAGELRDAWVEADAERKLRREAEAENARLLGLLRAIRDHKAAFDAAVAAQLVAADIDPDGEDDE